MGIRIVHIGLKGIPVKPGGGGIELFVYQLSKELVQKGCHVAVYARKWYQSDNSQRIHDGIEIIQTPSIKFGLVDPISHSLFSALHALIIERSTIIHLHGYVSYFTIFLFKLFKKKVVITLHGNILENISYTKLQKIFLKILINIGLKFGDVITTVSKEQYRLLAGLKKIVYYTPYGVDQKSVVNPDIITRKYNLERDKYILFLGRIERVKRVDWIIKAQQLLAMPYKLVIAGESSDKEYLRDCKYLARDNGNVIFTGFVEGHIKRELLSNCLLFVLPSVSEGMPTALLEAMSYGSICLVTDIDSLNSLVSENKNGFLFNGTYEDFQEKLNMILNREVEQLVRIKEEARRFVESKYSLDKTVSIFDKIYKEAVCH